MYLSPDTRKRIETANKIFATVVAIVFCAALLYEVVDFFGTLDHWWVGNRMNVAIVAAMESGARTIFDTVAPVVVAALAHLLWLGAQVFVGFGLNETAAEHTAKLVGILIALLGDLWLIYFLAVKKRWLFPLWRS